VIECDSTVFDEQHDGARGHQLRVREDPENVVVAQGHNPFAVGKAVAKHVDRLPSTQQRRGHARDELIVNMLAHGGM
jgi:hypothetical protein